MVAPSGRAGVQSTAKAGQSTGLQRPCRISPEARIEEGAEVSDSVVGAGCVVENGCRLTHSVLLPGTVVETGTELEDALADPYGTTRIGESSQTEHPR